MAVKHKNGIYDIDNSGLMCDCTKPDCIHCKVPSPADGCGICGEPVYSNSTFYRDADGVVFHHHCERERIIAEKARRREIMPSRAGYRCVKCGEEVSNVALAWFDRRQAVPHRCEGNEPMKCHECEKEIGDDEPTITAKDGDHYVVFHEACHEAKEADPATATRYCSRCDKPIQPHDDWTLDGNHYHRTCLEEMWPNNLDRAKNAEAWRAKAKALEDAMIDQEGELLYGQPEADDSPLDVARESLRDLARKHRQMADAHSRLMEAATQIIHAIGEDVTREGLKDTPRRFADAWVEFAFHEDNNQVTRFCAVESDQIVMVRDIRVWSYCEHHLLPFRCDVTIAYLGKDTLLGLSKFARIAVACAHRLQTQERLAHEIANEIESAAYTKDVAVLCKGEHTCMSMRGVKRDAEMLNVVVRGLFRSDSAVRAEFYSLARG